MGSRKSGPLLAPAPQSIPDVPAPHLSAGRQLLKVLLQMVAASLQAPAPKPSAPARAPRAPQTGACVAHSCAWIEHDDDRCARSAPLNLSELRLSQHRHESRQPRPTPRWTLPRPSGRGAIHPHAYGVAWGRARDAPSLSRSGLRGAGAAKCSRRAHTNLTRDVELGSRVSIPWPLPAFVP